MKVARNHLIVWPDRYYVWTYYPKKYQSSIYKVNKRTLYKKHYCIIPYFTRKHAKHVVTFYHGVKALHYIHIIYGKKLISQGVTFFNGELGGRKRYRNCIFIKGKPVHLRQWAYPPEWKMDSHRRRKYICSLNRAFGKGGPEGRRKFDQYYTKRNHGNNYRGFSTAYLRRKYKEATHLIFKEILQARRQDED